MRSEKRRGQGPGHSRRPAVDGAGAATGERHVSVNCAVVPLSGVRANQGAIDSARGYAARSSASNAQARILNSPDMDGWIRNVWFHPLNR